MFSRCCCLKGGKPNCCVFLTCTHEQGRHVTVPWEPLPYSYPPPPKLTPGQTICFVSSVDTCLVFLTCVRWNDCSSPPSGVGSLCQFHLYRKPSVWFGCVPDLCEKMAARSRSIVHVHLATLSHNSLSPSFLPPVSAGDSKIVKLFPGSELDSSAPMNI